MSSEFSSSSPALVSDELGNGIWSDYEAIADHLTEPELEFCNKMIKAAREVCPAVCDLPNNRGKTGFAVTITKRIPGFPMLTFLVGKVTETDEEYGPDGKAGKYTHYSRKKAEVLQKNPRFVSSGQNESLPDELQIKSATGKVIPAGAVAMGEWIISVSAFKVAGYDTASALAIGAGAGVKPLEAIEMLARDEKVRCPEFMRWADKILPKSAYTH